LLLYDPEANRRYEVELQLGKVDESHIIRTIEYWDIERKRNPQYDHCAVIIAEEITSRFLNVISLFNGHIPLIAIQLKAIKVGDNISLFFTKVLDEIRLELHEEDVEQKSVDRSYWEKLSTTNSLKLTDDLLKLINENTQEFSLKYNKPYIGLVKDGFVSNFVTFIPRKNNVIVNIKLDQSEEITERVKDMDTLPYDRSWGNYRFRVQPRDLENYVDILKALMNEAKESYFG